MLDGWKGRLYATIPAQPSRATCFGIYIIIIISVGLGLEETFELQHRWAYHVVPLRYGWDSKAQMERTITCWSWCSLINLQPFALGYVMSTNYKGRLIGTWQSRTQKYSSSLRSYLPTIGDLSSKVPKCWIPRCHMGFCTGLTDKKSDMVALCSSFKQICVKPPTFHLGYLIH